MHQPTRPTFEITLAAFLRSLEGSNKSRATITAYRSDLAQFVAFLEETNCTIGGPANVRREDIAEYLGSLADKGITGKSRARKLSTLREYFRYLEANGQVDKSPTLGIETPKKERNGRTTLRPDEYTQLLALAGGNPRDYAILQVFLQTGIRVSELCALTREDIDLAERTLRVARGKGMQERTIELEPKGIKAFRSYLTVRPQSLYEELFLNYQGEPLSDRGVRKMLAKYLKQAGITKPISPHSLRHTFATRKAERGISAFQLKEWLGHSRLDTTQIYVHMSKTNARKQMEATSL
jgi:site-specific recombinase XerD